MKVSELIEKLKSELEMHGDLNVYFDIDCDGYGESEFDAVVFLQKQKNAWDKDPEREDRIVLHYK